MKLLVTGGGGQVATALRAGGDGCGISVAAFGHRRLDICDRSAVAAAAAAARPDLLVNCAAYTRVDVAEQQRERAFATNAEGAGNLALAAAAANIPLVHLSTDYVFDGQKSGPYVEDDPPNPASVYGQSKLAGEAAVRRHQPRHLILRTAWVFAARGQNFVLSLLRHAEGGRKRFQVVADQHGGPTPAAAIADCLLRLCPHLLSGGFEDWGTYHFCGRPATTWHGFASAIFQNRPEFEIQAITTAEWPTPAPRPANSVLDCSKLARKFGIEQPDWRQGLAMVLAELETASPN